MNMVIRSRPESQSEQRPLELTEAQLSTVSGGQNPTVTVLPWAFSSAGFTTVTAVGVPWAPTPPPADTIGDFASLFAPAVQSNPVICNILQFTIGLVVTLTAKLLDAVAAQARADSAINAVKDYYNQQLQQQCNFRPIPVGAFHLQLNHGVVARSVHANSEVCSTVEEEAMEAQAEEDVESAQTPDELETALSSIEGDIEIGEEAIESFLEAVEGIEALLALA